MNRAKRPSYSKTRNQVDSEAGDRRGLVHIGEKKPIALNPSGSDVGVNGGWSGEHERVEP